MRKITLVLTTMLLFLGMILPVGCNKQDDLGGNGGGDPSEEGEYIDLGLPSGVLWASCNVGADKPEAFGNYFAWGEIATKSTYDWSTYDYWDGSQVTKYTGSDDLYVLLSEDDVAVAMLGDDWRIPTKEEWDELLSNCEESWTNRNGVNGRLFIGPNGKSIFLPAAGYYNNSMVTDQGYNGRYWSSSLYADNTVKAWRLLFQSGIIDINAYDRCFGQSIRAVRDLR